MEIILYHADWKRIDKQKPVRVRAGVLVSVWGVICRAGVSLPTLGLRRPRAYAYLKSPPSYHLRSFLIGIANSLIVFSIAGLLLTFYPVLMAELGYRQKRVSQKVSQVSPNQPPVARAYFADLLASSTSEVYYAPDPLFSIVIPKIEAFSAVIANVDSSNRSTYQQALKKGVAHAAGFSFPGMGETIWLFAHSTDAPWNITRFNAVFYLLREIGPGDKVIVFFNGKRFNYQVYEKRIVEPWDTSFLANEGREKLALQTCWPPGTTLKRLIVLARPAL